MSIQISGVTVIDDDRNISNVGVITASSFDGAGKIGINTSGGNVGYGVSLIEFRGSGISTTTFDNTSGIATVNIEGGGGFNMFGYILS